MRSFFVIEQTSVVEHTSMKSNGTKIIDWLLKRWNASWIPFWTCIIITFFNFENSYLRISDSFIKYFSSLFFYNIRHLFGDYKTAVIMDDFFSVSITAFTYKFDSFEKVNELLIMYCIHFISYKLLKFSYIPYSTLSSPPPLNDRYFAKLGGGD